MTISAACTVKDGGGSPVVTTNGVNITPANTITIQLAALSGVDIWTLTIVGMDEVTAAPTVSINYTTKTATFTAPASGAAIRFQSSATSQNGIHPTTGRTGYTVTETFCVYTLTGGKRVAALGETFEGDADFGWTTKVNDIIRTGGGGGSTPSGTGFRHVTAGTEDGAAALVVNADVSASAAIAGSKLASDLAITTSVAVGTNPASVGGFRLPKNAWLTARNSINSGDYNLVGTNAADFIFIGDTNANGLVVQTFSSGNLYLRMGANDVLVCYSGSIRAVQPITGEDVGYSTPYGVHGTGTVAEGDTARTEVAGIYKYTHIIYTGAMTAGRTVTFPLPGSLAGSYHKTIFNNTSGGFAITLTNTGGTTVAVAAGKTALLAFEPAGVRRLTADV
jgi:hypothetical protein